MRLKRLKLENWRGVDAREVEFADGVTLIEGPNEIGKSTLVQAIRYLFTVMSSSTKADIKAIQPVGRDVGSFVQVEAEVGGYHLIYSKTYNRNRQTELNVLAPQPLQLTGREAHERVEQILEQSVDMALWNALLVEQGSKIEGVTLSRSDGLARALDEAAGGESPDRNDTDLFARVQAEYEQYFTLITGKPKYAALESDLDAARAAVAAASTAMRDIETDSDAHERCLAEIRRLEADLPALQQEQREYEAGWQAIASIREQVAIKQRELEAATELLKAAEEETARRKGLIESLETGRQALETSRQALAPQAQQLDALKASVSAASAALNAGRTELKTARAAAELARADLQHLENSVLMESINGKLERIEEHNVSLAATRVSLQGIRIDADGLDELRQAQNDVLLAQARLDTATSSIRISAEDRLQLRLNDEDLALEAGAVEQRAIASEMRLSLPGVLSLRITPSQSANELEAEAEDRREALARLLKKYAATDLADAVALEAKRAAGERDVKSRTEKIDVLLGDDALADLQAHAEDLKERCRDYVAQRSAAPQLPDGLADARAMKAQAEQLLAEREKAVEAAQAAWEALREDHAEAGARHSVARQEVAGLEKIIEQQQRDLADSRAAQADQALGRRLEEKAAAVGALKIELGDLSERLESASPEAAEALLANARAACARAAKDLAFQQTQRAVLEDRLTKAQADGRFETLEAAQHKLAALEEAFNATAARAAAAARLWQVMSRHRDEARRAYVRPLQEGVEQLGKIVFGADFSIELGDDWGLKSRTLEGRTIPFEALSVGAREQLGILMRLAAARIVSGQGGVPLIIDDALGFSDPLRLRTMGAAIASAGNDCQIIVLTSTPGRFTHLGSARVVRL